MTHFLQSPAWERVQQALGRTVISRSGDGWSYVAVIEKGKINTRLYCPYGPVLSSPDALQPALEALRADARKHHVAFVRVEPTGDITAEDMNNVGLRRVARVQPAYTSVVDLTPPFEDILAGMSPTNRNLHRTYSQKGLSVTTSHSPADITKLTTLLQEVAQHTGMHRHSDQYLRTQAETLLPTGDATLYFVEYKGKTIVAALVFDDDTTRYYAHAAADYEHRKLGAGTIIVTQMIQDAKKKGLTSFDLYGILPDAPTHLPWAGITKFKRSFGGRDVAYAGTWELPIRPLSYGLYRLLLRFTKQRI